VTSYSSDYIALLSRHTVAQSKSNYAALIEKVDPDTYLSLINTTFDNGDREEEGDEWVNSAAVLSLLVRNLSGPGIADIPCNTVLVVLLKLDLSAALSDAMLTALSTNRNLKIVVYRFPLVHNGSGMATPPVFTNLQGFLCNGRTLYEDLSSGANLNSDSWNIFSLVALQGLWKGLYFIKQNYAIKEKIHLALKE